MKVLLIGEHAAAVRTLQSLAQGQVQIVAVMASAGGSAEWLLVRQVFREGKYLPAKEVLKAGNCFADSLTNQVSIP